MAKTESKNTKASHPDDKTGGDAKDVGTTKVRGHYPQDQQFVSERQFPEEQPPVAPLHAGPNDDPLSIPADTQPGAVEYGQPHGNNVPGWRAAPTERDKDEKRKD